MPTTVLEALSMAGGLTPTAGTDLTILRTESLEPQGPSEAKREPSSRQSTIKIDLASLLSGKDPAGNAPLQPEDALTVSTAPVVYVVGAVGKPGAFVIQDPNSGLTVLKAVALAEGLKPIASGKHCLIIRRTASSQQPEDIPIDLAKLMAHKIQDNHMSFNDILFVSESSSKKNVRAMAQTAQSALVGIATYCIGYRVARYFRTIAEL
jgi:polysaccharide export outer membrane protein